MLAAYYSHLHASLQHWRGVLGVWGAVAAVACHEGSWWLMAAWLRFLSIGLKSYECALLSGIALGGGTAIIMPSLALLPMRWCAPSTSLLR
mgnify:CR=1 FL=1